MQLENDWGQQLPQLQEMIRASKRIVFFGGAGTSTESGIPDFRSAEGLYNQDGNGYAPEEILSHSFFMAHPESFYRFYKNSMLYPEARPHDGHHALVRLEQMGKLQAIVTQNIDGMHQLAGSGNVLELHGSVHRNRCLQCGASYTLADVLQLLGEQPVPACSACGGLVKPEVVLYEESLDMELLEQAAAYIQAADMLIIAGSSMTVQPAAGLVRLYRGDRMVLINKAATPIDRMVDMRISASIAAVLGSLVKEE